MIILAIILIIAGFYISTFPTVHDGGMLFLIFALAAFGLLCIRFENLLSSIWNIVVYLWYL